MNLPKFLEQVTPGFSHDFAAQRKSGITTKNAAPKHRVSLSTTDVIPGRCAASNPESIHPRVL